jgi:hypothetical protein
MKAVTNVALAGLLLALSLGPAVADPLPPAIAESPLPMAEGAPTTDEVQANTRPMVRARLRLPDSLQDFSVAEIAALPDDPTRYAVRVTFKARTPFGALTAHEARFLMKRSSRGTVWIVTTP